ncbi:MAG: SGNH/GDSL hydrolase family protein [Desulfobulbaceae bacterium]|nr:SGNH/GDSL hydrolase family protein [Desulfobulbaceae bacterium]
MAFGALQFGAVRHGAFGEFGQDRFGGGGGVGKPPLVCVIWGEGADAYNIIGSANVLFSPFVDSPDTQSITWDEGADGYVVTGDMIVSSMFTSTLLISGDSTVTPVCRYLRQAVGVTRYLKYTDIAKAGDTISLQSSRFAALSSVLKAVVKTVVVEIGLNDLHSDEEAYSDISARYQEYIDAIKTAIPSAKIYIATIVPSFGFSAADADYKAKWLLLDADIRANVFGAHYVISGHTDLLHAGDYILKAMYDSGDGLHPNDAGAKIIGDAWANKLITDGVL